MHPREMPNVSFTDVLQFWGHLIQSSKSPPNSFSHINHIPVSNFSSVYIIIINFPDFFKQLKYLSFVFSPSAFLKLCKAVLGACLGCPSGILDGCCLICIQGCGV